MSPLFPLVSVIILAAAVGWIAMRAFRRGRKLFAWTLLGSTVAVVACVAIAGTFAAMFMFRGARIQGRAMEPTLAD